jgi:hypothetical protein
MVDAYSSGRPGILVYMGTLYIAAMPARTSRARSLPPVAEAA